MQGHSDELVFSDLHRVDVFHLLLEPALLVGNLHVISGHLTLLHQSILPKRPVLCKHNNKEGLDASVAERGGVGSTDLEAVRAVPLLAAVRLRCIPLVPELWEETSQR